jgi:SAM-dependent methyltransferase
MPSFDQPDRPVTEPSPWVVRFGHLVPTTHRVLDVACGSGRHSRWLAAWGHRILAVDVDAGAFTVKAPGVEFLALDLETGGWPLGDECFAGIVVTNYLYRPHFPWYVQRLIPGGCLLIDTFGAGNERLGRPRNPEFLLKDGELLEAFGTRLRVVAYESGEESRPRPAVRQRLCAVKP